MLEGILAFFSVDGFVPHGYCLTWRPDVFWAYVGSDAVIALFYFSIPAALIYFYWRRRDQEYRWVLLLFGAFIVACGATHAFSIWTLWVPDYGVEALLKAATALVSFSTAVILWLLMPHALAMPSRRDVEDKNAELDRLNQRLAAAYAEQQKVTEALRQSEDRYRGMVETQIDMVLCLDVRGHFTFVNETTCRVFGRPREALIGRSWQEFVSPEDVEATGAEIVTSMGPPYPRVQVENRILTAEGERWYAWEGMCVRVEGGQRMEVQAVGRDITERRRADDERKNQLLFLRSLIEAIPAAVFYKDQQGIYLGCNRLFADLMGRAVDGIIGHAGADLFAPEVATKFHASDRRIFETREPHVYDFVRTWGGNGTGGGTGPEPGRERHLRTYKAPFDRADGSLGGLIGIVIDNTDDIRREEDLRQARRAAEQASRSKSGFLANMSHEIRTPMNAILGLIYLLEQTELTAVQREYVHKTQLSARSLLGILNDTLDLSKIEAGRLALEAAPFRLDTLMKTLATITAANARDKDIEVLFRIAPGVPVTLVGDALRLQQILLNLTGNAVKFTNRGEVVLAVEAVPAVSASGGSATPGSDAVCLAFSVRDTGVGITADQVDAIFEPFAQADASTTRRYGGTGLGLSICKRLVALMGGEISVDSEVGRGSTFRFTATLRGGVQEVIPVVPPDLGRAGPLRVLVADDNPTAREVMATMVAQFGWTVTVAASGREALAAIDRSADANRPFDLILLDWVMPEIGGREILGHLHRCYSPETLPVILVVTAFEHDRIRREVGADPYIRVVLTKPVTPSVLLDAVSSVCSVKPPKAATSASASVAVGREALAGRTLLLVEDNLINQMVGRRILEGAGATVEVAASGVEALAAAAAPGRPIDAVLMDIQMPGMDGYETTRHLRALPATAHLPVIAMTANAAPADRDRCLAAGMNDHIGKPLDVAQMVEVIQRHICPPRTATYKAGSRTALAEIEPEVALARVFGDVALLRQVVKEFIRQFMGEPEVIARQLAEGDFATVGRKAHELKGVAANVGASRLVNVADTLQSAIRHGDHALAQSVGPEACRLLTIVLASCTRWLGSSV